MIIDSHLHLNQIDNSYDKAYQKLLLDMEANGIDRAILIPDNVTGSGCVDLETALKYASEKILLIGSPNILEPKAGEYERLDQLLGEKKIIGLKLFPGHDAFYANDERCEKYFELCLKHNVPVIFHTGINTGDVECAKWNDPKLIVAVAEKYPELKIVLAHYFWPKMDYCYEVTKGHKNIFFDTSGMADPEVVEETGGIDKVRNALEKTAMDRAESVIFGADYDMCDVRAHIDLINSLNISEELKTKIFYKNAMLVFGI